MKDLTQGSIPKLTIQMAIPIGVGMLVQTLYYLVDLYFVGKLGDVALAGVSAAGNAMFLIMALTQILNVGTIALVSHAVGAKDKAGANLIFNQSLLLSCLVGFTVLIFGYLFASSYLSSITSDLATEQAGTEYLHWFIPCMALQFAMISMVAALRGTGIVKPTMIVQMLSLLLNIILAPILIAGWITGKPMGVAGAGLASSISVLLAVVLLFFYFSKRKDKFITVDKSFLKPNFSIWKRMVKIGFPAGGEFLLMFCFMAVIYWAIKDFGSAAQAGFGLGSRMMQAIFLPAMAIAFAAPAVAGQNYGANLHDRVRQTFKATAIMSSVVMLLLSLLCQINPHWFVQSFSSDPQVVIVAAVFLQIIAWNFVPSGLIFTCSGMFQALGNTWPSLISTGTRLVTFAIPAIWLSKQPAFEIEQLWYLSVITVLLQALLSLYLLFRQFKQKLEPTKPLSLPTS